MASTLDVPHMTRHLLVRLLLSLGAALVFLGGAPPRAEAQMVVSDPTNLVQNTSSAVAEVQSTIQQLRQIKAQLQMLTELDLTDLDDLRRALEQVRQIARSTLALARRWADLAGDFRNTYGMCGEPPRLFGDAYPSIKDRARGLYEDLSRRWACTTQEAAEENLKTQAEVARANGELAQEVERLEAKTKSIQGTRDAGQLNAQLNSVQANQNALLLEVMLKRSHAEQTARSEERARAEAASARHRERLGRYFGQVRSEARPVELSDF